MRALHRVAAYFKDKQLLLIIFIAIVLALAMTVISLHLYTINYVSRLDVSRPDRENIRPSTGEEETLKFDASGNLDTKALTVFQTLYTKSREDLNKLGTFDGDPLNPDSLQSMSTANE